MPLCRNLILKISAMHGRLKKSKMFTEGLFNSLTFRLDNSWYTPSCHLHEATVFKMEEVKGKMGLKGLGGQKNCHAQPWQSSDK